VQHTGRTDLEQLRDRLLAESFPRLQMTALLGLAGLGAFLCSAGLLRIGVASMGVRYGFAALSGYALFLAFVRVWLAWQQRRWALELDALDAIEIADVLSSTRLEIPAAVRSARLLDGLPDLQDSWHVALALSVLCAGAIALGAVVYASPLLFAEVLLDAAVVGALYRRARRHSRGHWLQGVVRRTWVHALVLCVFAAVVGSALQSLAPEAQSLGAILRATQR